MDALRDLVHEIQGKTVVCIVSGGNFDFSRLPDIEERSMRASGLKRYFLLRLPQRPGALKEFLHLLGPEDDISRFEYMKKSSRTRGTVLLGIDTTKAEHFDGLLERMRRAGFVYQDVTDDKLLVDFVV